MLPCSQAFGGEEYCERALYQEVKAVRRRDGRDSTKSRQSEETFKRLCEEGAEAGSSFLPRTQSRRFGMDGCGRQFASERFSKDSAKRSKQEWSRRPTKPCPNERAQSATQTKEKEARPAKVQRPTATPYPGVPLLHPIQEGQVTTRDPMPDMDSISSASQTKSSTSSTASSSM